MQRLRRRFGLVQCTLAALSISGLSLFFQKPSTLNYLSSLNTYGFALTLFFGGLIGLLGTYLKNRIFGAFLEGWLEIVLGIALLVRLIGFFQIRGGTAVFAFLTTLSISVGLIAEGQRVLSLRKEVILAYRLGQREENDE